MRTMSRWPGSFGGLLFVLVCTGSPQAPPQNPAGGLGGTSWHLVKFQGGDDRTLSPDYQGKYTIAFESDGRVSVRIDCNRGHGTWKSSGPNQLKFGPLVLTRKMCRHAALNERIAKDWVYIRSYILKDNHLFLSVTAADGGIYEFEPAAQAAQAGGSVQQSSSASKESEIARGQHLVMEVARCPHCHTPRDSEGRLDRSHWLMGGPIWIRPVQSKQAWSLHAPALAGFPYSDQQGRDVLERDIGTNGIPIQPPMHAYHQHHDEAVAITTYLRSQRPAS